MMHDEALRAAAARADLDRLFARAQPASDFAFDQNTAGVFDDMVDRSVPFYGEIQRMVGELASEFATADGSLYDLGCATGTTLALLDHLVDPAVPFVGIDNSPAMLAKARDKLERLESRRQIDLIAGDIDRVEIGDAKVVLLVLTLMFVRPMHRANLLRRIRAGMREGGCLILVEKLTVADDLLNRLYISFYYAMKRRNGYTELEIAQKREALENVLIPYRLDENRELLREAGFRSVEEFFRWYNFAGLVALV